MPISLSNLKSFPGSTRKKKRVGRGNASGHGTSSTRGAKGQKARSGGRRGLKQKGMKRMIQSIPKLRGFKSRFPKYEVINIGDLERKFTENDIIDKAKLVEAGLLKNSGREVKVLGNGQLKKKLTIKANAFSIGAKEAIEKAGGKTELLAGEETAKKKISDKK